MSSAVLSLANSPEFQALAEGIKRYRLLEKPRLTTLARVVPQKDFAVEIMADSIAILIDNGWFISVDRTPCELMNLSARYFRFGRTDAGTTMMFDHFRTLVDEIGTQLQSNFPHRAGILRKAFDAHKRGDFELSIIAMLTQADGIGEEIFGSDISPSSTGQDSMNKRKQFVQENIHSSLKSTLPTYCCALSAVLPINANQGRRSEFLAPLNRHMILHGLSTDYATEVNGLKTVSWLQYINSFHSFAREKSKRDAVTSSRV